MLITAFLLSLLLQFLSSPVTAAAIVIEDVLV